MSTVRIYQLIQKANLAMSESEAEELVDEFEKLVYRRFDDRKEMLATKVDLAETEKRIAKEIADIKVDLGKDMNRIYRSLLTWIVIAGVLGALPEIIEIINKYLL